MLRVVLGKGGKDRYVPLTRAAAEAIDAYLAKGRPKLLLAGSRGGGSTRRRRRRLFVAARGGVLYRATLDLIVHHWAKEAGIKKRVTPPHLPPQHRDPPPQGRRRHPAHPGAPRPREPLDDRALHARRDLGPAGGRAACAPAGPLSFGLSSRATSSRCASAATRRRRIEKAALEVGGSSST